MFVSSRSFLPLLYTITSEKDKKDKTMNSSENLSISDYSLDYENDEGFEKDLKFWIEGVITPVVSLFGVLGKIFIKRLWKYFG